jgi:signal transduction histidine kinase
VLFTATALAWIVRLTQYYYDENGLWFPWVAVNSLLWAITCTYLFALSLSGARAGRLGRALAGVALTITLLSSPAVGVFGDIWIAAPWINLFAVALSVVLGIQLTLIGYRDRHRSIYALTFAGALWISLAFGVHDLLMQLNVISQAGIYLLPYGALLQVLTFASGVYWRLASTVGEVEQLNRELGERVKATEERLHKAYSELSVLEKQSAVDDERQRLMREMHDGLGSGLMTSLTMAERGSVDQTTMIEALRECLQQLQLTVDSLEPMGGDLATVLGTLRYRLGARLEAAGLRVHWQVAPLPALAWLDAHAALHVLRIVQEVLTNILKHSGATDITLATEADGDSVRVRVIDNGRGFDVALRMLPGGRPAGHGLVNIARRAQQLRGRTRIESGPEGTSFDLILPID